MGFNAKYDRDFYAWTREQAARLREAAATGTNLPLDWENLAEEIESLGRSDFNGLTSQMTRIIEHLLKLELSPASDPRKGWRHSVEDARVDIEYLLEDSPSLGPRLPDALARSWRKGRIAAARGLERDGIMPQQLPSDCPYSIDQILDGAFWPVNRHGLA
ncbi:DUF29 domain-containing protein [Azospirillum sp. SYSU D00513]|uniref:DUF29 domain-containing protein n=1 Tax=Azospirillum sp. SYSU D00513 TaxID=2812561 RepID=UPI001A96ECF6|nr:DUF29 domain-containing protein [Azospirillum sp. SYSU D00513]